MTEITPDDLSTRLDGDDDELVVLDIRLEDDYEDWHIPGSENIDVYDELQNNHKTAKASLSEIQDEKDIVTVCTAGVISETATDLLREMDYRAQTLVDGMNGWSRVHRSAPIDVDVDGTLVQVTRPGKGCLSYVLISDGAAAIFDPSHYPDPYERVLEEYDAELVGVFDTHAHADHISGGRALAQRHDVSYHLHPADADGIDVASLSDEQTIEIGNSEVTVVHTPGHSPGGVSFAVEDAALLTGDTLFHESVGRVELGVEAGIEESDVEENAAMLYESLQRLQEQPDDPLVLPAHDPGSPEPPVTARLSAVETRNADLGRDRADFVADLTSDTPDHPSNFQRVKRVNIGAETVDDDELSTLELGPNRCASK